MADDRQECFLRLFTSLEPALRVHVRRLVPSRADADDVLQEVAVVLWRKFDDFEPDTSFRSWAFKVAKYEVLAWRRDKARGREILSETVIELLADESDRDEPRFARERELLRQCLAAMQQEHRNLLLAAYQPGARIQDVALRSGRSIGGFYQWLHRVKRTLLECVAKRSEAATALPSTENI